MIRHCSPDHTSGYSSPLTFNNAFQKVTFTRLASNMNANIMVPEIKAEFFRKRHLLPMSLRPWAHCNRKRRWFHVKETLCKGVCTYSPKCSRHGWIDKVDRDILVAMDQCAVNCLDEAVCSINAMRTKFLSWTFDIISGFSNCPILV